MPDLRHDEPRAGEDLEVVRPPAVMEEEDQQQPFQALSTVSALDVDLDGLGWRGQGFKVVSDVCVAIVRSNHLIAREEDGTYKSWMFHCT